MELELARWVATDFVSTVIVLNFTSTNSFLSFPTLTCEKSGEPVSNKPMTYMTSRIGENNISPNKANKKSKVRINFILSICFIFFNILILVIKFYLIHGKQIFQEIPQ